MTFLAAKREEALALVSQWVEGISAGTDRLSRRALHEHGGDDGWDGWRLPLGDGSGGSLLLLLDPDFPYSLPRFALERRGDLLRAPHVEAHARLCLAGESGRVHALDPVAVVDHEYREALALIDDDDAGGNREDFSLDFDAYWRRDITSPRGLRIWLREDARSRIVYAWQGTAFYFVAETPDDVRTWLANWRAQDEDPTLTEAGIIWLRSLPEPHEYPNRGGALRAFIQRLSPDGLPVFDRLMTMMQSRATVVLAGPTSAGDVRFAGIVAEDPEQATRGQSPPVHAARGFRPGHVPAGLLAGRRRMLRVDTRRVDEWLHRLPAELGQTLADKRVAVLGCGSLGGGVARAMLQSGIGHLSLMDPDSMGWENISRHELGAESVGRNKAEALVARFTPMYPHVRELVGYPLSWQQVLREQPGMLADYDLLLSLTGNWNAESALNDLQRHGMGEVTSPILYGWMEDQAAAAHAVAIGAAGICFRCGFSGTGSVRVPATTWRETDDGSCGGATSVYGAVDLMPAQSLVTALAVDVLLGRALPPVRRSWLALRSTLRNGGGDWHPRWVEEFGDPGPGGLLIATPWPDKAQCPCLH